MKQLFSVFLYENKIQEYIIAIINGFKFYTKRGVLLLEYLIILVQMDI